MSEALDTVRDERANGRLSPAVASVLDEFEERLSLLERPADDATEATDGGE